MRRLLLALTLVLVLPLPARAFECACPTEMSGGSASFFNGRGILGMLMSGMDSTLNSSVSSFMGSLYSSIVGSAQPMAESQAVQTVTPVNKHPNDEFTSNNYQKKMARATAIKVSADYAPPKSACVQSLRQHEMDAMERTKQALIDADSQEKLD